MKTDIRVLRHTGASLQSIQTRILDEVATQEKKYKKLSAFYHKNPNEKAKKAASDAFVELQEKEGHLRRDVFQSITTVFQTLQASKESDYRTIQAANCIDQKADYDKANAILQNPNQMGRMFDS